MPQPNVINDGTFFVDKVQVIDLCGSKAYQFTGSNFAKPKDFTRLVYPEHNLNKCPDCRKRYEQALQAATERFNAFPDCCDAHRRLNSAPWFNRADFEGFPKLYADKLLYTWHHICHHIDGDNWKEECCDFFEYIFNSFGSFPDGYGEALCMGMFIRDITGQLKKLDVYTDRRDFILQFIHDCYNPQPNKKSDLTILASTYNEWFKTFPFELSFLSHLKPHFEKNLPFLASMHTNKYIGLTKGIMRTKEELAALLVKITDTVLTNINTSKLYENGEIDDIDKMELELVLQERNQKLKQGYTNSSKDPETRYRRILKAWFKDEIAFIKKLRPIAERISKKETALHEALLNACAKMQENKLFYDADENTRTRQILDLLPIDFTTKDQSLYGKSGTGKKQGSVDGVITDHKHVEYFLEALNLNCISTESIITHINKLESNYDSRGLRTKYVLVYCNIKDGTLPEFHALYRQFIEQKMPFKYPLLSLSEEEANYTNIRILKSLHNREGSTVTLYHLLIKMPEC